VSTRSRTLCLCHFAIPITEYDPAGSADVTCARCAVRSRGGIWDDRARVRFPQANRRRNGTGERARFVHVLRGF